MAHPSDWSAQESKSSDEPINVATFVSPTGPDSNPTADISIYMDKLHNYAHSGSFVHLLSGMARKSIMYCYVE
jgi:hypothetical protein